MYGMIHKSIRELVIQSYGENRWERIAQDAEVDPEDFLSLRNYDDGIVYRLVSACSENLSMDPNELLVAFGKHWVLVTAAEQYDQLIKSYGKNTLEVLENINHMHARISTTFIDYRPPMFTTEYIDENRATLHYSSSREGLSPFVVGLVEGLADLYGETIEIKQINDCSGDHNYSAVFSLVRH